MKTYKNLYSQIYSFDNLLTAAKKAQKGKRFKPNVSRFNMNVEKELLTLQHQLKEQSYKPGKYRHFTIYESKKRNISAAPYRDRIVHHALCNIIEPLFDRMFIYDTYACRKAKGTHKAVERFSQFSRKNAFVLKCDISKYFQSIDHQILLNVFNRKLKCPGTMWLVKSIINSSDVDFKAPLYYFAGDDLFTPTGRPKGLPIGNQTSQFFANVYLNDFDHFVKDKLKCRFYIRYVDDFVILEKTKERLFDVMKDVRAYMEDLRLLLHPFKCSIFPVQQGTNFLGYKIFPTHRLVLKDNVKRFKRKLKRFQNDYANEQASLEQINASVQSWLGHAKWANSFLLRSRLFSEFQLKKGQVKNAAGSSWRLVEQ